MAAAALVRVADGAFFDGKPSRDRVNKGVKVETRRSWVVVGLDNGATSNNVTVLDASGRYLIDALLEGPSRVELGPDEAVLALGAAFDRALEVTDIERSSVRVVGLDTPGPASADGIISSKGSTNFSQTVWHGYDVRGALEGHLGIPVVYNNDGNAAALYAHRVHFGHQAPGRSSISAIVGTGLGGGLIESGRVIRGAAGMAGELGHVHIPMEGLLREGQERPVCNCGFVADAESIASLTGIENNLLPYWLGRFPDHPLAHEQSMAEAAKRVREYGDRGDPMALEIFAQQAIALGCLFTIAANFFDPDAYFVGGGVVEASEPFRQWFLGKVREHTTLRQEQLDVTAFALIPDLDMAGARGAALAAFDSIGVEGGVGSSVPAPS